MEKPRTGDAGGQGGAGATASPPKSTPTPAAPASGTGQQAPTPQEVAREARDAAGDVAQEVVGEVQRRTTARLEEQVGRAAERIGTVSQAMQAVSRQLREQDDTTMAQWAEQAADQVDRLAGYLRGKDFDELVYEGERFARRQPALFLGGAFLLGLAAARFLKSSSHHDDRYRDRDWPAYYGGRGYAPRQYSPPVYGGTGSPGYSPPAPPSSPRSGMAPSGTGTTGTGTRPTGTASTATGTTGSGMTGTGAGSTGTHAGTRHPGAPTDRA